jgi:hypothetical protein
MNISFINQVNECKRILDLLTERASDEDSQFHYSIQSAKWNIDRVAATYQEVLDRDANEDQSFRPIKEVK